MARGEKQPPPVYECRPPEWLPKSHNDADLGYVGFFPPRPNEEEETLTQAKVQNGYSQGPIVPAEAYSAHESAMVMLAGEDTLAAMEDLMSLIFARKAEDIASIPPSTFKLPSRVTMNDSKRQAWFDDLANPDVPLHKLGKSIPHLAKGHDLLDLLHAHSVAIPRAVWFLRVCGGNETAGLRNKPGYNPTQYSVDWANLIVGYLRKQLAEIALPMAPRPGINIKQSFKGVLSDQASRDKWLSRFTYSLNLLRSFYAEGLVDHRTFFAWLVQQMGTCNLAQLGFVARLADEYFDGMLVSRALMRPFVEACFVRAKEVYLSGASSRMPSLVYLLESLILRSLLAHRDAFVNPRVWDQFSGSLETYIKHHVQTNSTGHGEFTEKLAQALDQTFLAIFDDIKRRNEAMLFRNLPHRILGSLSSTLADIKLLNSISSSSDMEAVPFFDGMAEPTPAFARKLDILLTWSVTTLQYGDHRPYAATTLLRIWRDKAEERAIRRDRESPHAVVQDHLFDWLDGSDVAIEQSNLPGVALLFGQLVKHGLFDYSQYVQRLIARGESGLCTTDEIPSRHQSFLQVIPLYASTASLISQRRVTLYGIRARETPEDRNEREIRKHIRALLPELFGGEPLPNSAIPVDFDLHSDGVTKAVRFEQVRVIYHWLLPLLKKNIQSVATNPDTSHPALKSYCISTMLMAQCRCYNSLLELTLYALERVTTHDFLDAALRTLQQHMEVWACLDVMKTIASYLFATHLAWKARGVHVRELIQHLLLDHERHLEPSERELLHSDQYNLTRLLRPDDQSEPVPPVLPEILLLAADPNLEAPSLLANALWYKYRSSMSWAWNVWDNTVASLRQVPFMTLDLGLRRAYALRYGVFLQHIDQHLPNGLPEHIKDWMLGAGRNEIMALAPEVWDLFTVMLMYLVANGVVQAGTILQALVYPTWQEAAMATSAQHALVLEPLLTAANDISTRLLLGEPSEDAVPPTDFREYLGLQTTRREVYRPQFFPSIIGQVTILVLIELNTFIPDHLRQSSRALREAMCSSSVFRMGTYRDLDTVHDAFQATLSSKDVAEEKHEPLVAALRFILSDGQKDGPSSPDSWRALSTILSPWKLAATSIELRFTMRQLDEAFNRPATKDRAEVSLQRLAAALFGQGMNSEEADFVAEMLKGVSPAVAGRIINAGLRRITEILQQWDPAAQTDACHELVEKAGDIFRLLTNLIEPLRKANGPSDLPQLDATTQDNLLRALHAKLAIIWRTLNPDKPDVAEMTRTTVFIARVLHFDLGLGGVWTTGMKSMLKDLCQTLVDLVVLYGSGPTLDTMVFPLLLDTLYYLLDEIPVDPKATASDPFFGYPAFPLRNLPANMPDEYRMRIRSLLPFLEPNTAVANLVYAPKDHAGPSNEQTPALVQNRPWEWTEYLGDTVAPDAPKPVTDNRHPLYHSNQPNQLVEHPSTLPNTTSIPLELFDAHVVGRRVDLNAQDPKVEGALKMLQDTTLSESIFRRDWRESRIDLSVSDGGVGVRNFERLSEGTGSGPSSGSERPSNSRMASPAGSARSRATTAASSGSRRASPAITTTYASQPSGLSRLSGSHAEPIDVDSLDVPPSSTTGTGSGSSSKRKAPDDDDVEIVEGPVAQTRKPKPRPKIKKK